MPYRIVFVLDAHTHLSPMESLQRRLSALGSEVSVQQLSTRLLDESDTEEAPWQALHQADFILLLTHGSVAYFRKFAFFREHIVPRHLVFMLNSMPEEMQEMLRWCKLSEGDCIQLTRYIRCRNEENLLQLCLFVSSRYGDSELHYQEPSCPEWDGLYLPEGISCIKTYKETVAEAKVRGRIVVGVLIPYYLYAEHNLRHIDALIQELRSLEVEPLVLFSTIAKDSETGSRGVYSAMAEAFYQQGQLLPDSIINISGYSLGIFEGVTPVWQCVEGESSPLLEMNVPMLQAYHTLYTETEWRTRIEGVDASTLVSSIYYPEFDGQIDGYPIGAKDDSDLERQRIIPLHEGIKTVASLAKRWAILRHKPNPEKRVALILHNMPPRADMIGSAAGLDTPASVYQILKLLQRIGVYCPMSFEEGNAIMQAIASRLSNDSTWLDDREVLLRAIDKITSQDYSEWYQRLEDSVQQGIEAYWGQAPGKFKVVDDVLPVPGLLLGNVFVGLQPPRGYEEYAEKIYHSPSVAPPHFYQAIYAWIKHHFKADVIIHLGTHGSLEWLPGKEKGLSNSCFPKVNIDDLPHLYPYHTTVIGEGIQAKRRSSAVLLHHLEPSSTEGGSYDDLSELDNFVCCYICEVASIAQKELLYERITELSAALALDKDLGHIHPQGLEREAYIEALHDWLGVLKRSMVKDGLHVYGLAPEGDRLSNFLRTMHRLSLGGFAAIEELLAQYYGYDYEVLRREPHRKWGEAGTSIMVLERLTRVARGLFESVLQESQLTPTSEKLRSFLGDGDSTCLDSLVGLLRFSATEVLPRILQTTDELANLERGLLGGFVPPRKGGSPTRGHLDILPTGCNMYAIDPNELPSRVAYEVGVRLGERLLEQYAKQEGSYPESLAFVLYSGDQMRTHGEDIGEILWLMGLKPMWLGLTSDRVIGLELIPLSELGRPRIDVVSRISGLLRDTFPSIISLLDDASKMVATLDEDPNQNYVRKHFLEDLQELKDSGIDPKLAEQEALVRVFGCPPGNYGGGIDILIESKAWQSSEDLATTAITWAAHAYGRELHGLVSRANLERQLRKVGGTVKNENTIDFDLYDVDDEFIYHGGLIAAVTHCSGCRPLSFYGNSSDPRFVEVRKLEEESARILRSRLLNPIWIEGLKQHGYKGAQDIAYNMDNVFGWSASAGIVEDWAYEALTEHLLGNELNRQFIEENNPWALHSIAEKLLEAAQRGLWHSPSEQALHLAQEVYLSSEGVLEEGGTIMEE